MTLQELTAKMKEGAAKKSAFGNTVKFATDQGVIYIDGNANPPAVSNEDGSADCTVKMAFSDLDDMIGGKLDGMTAFMTGKLKIEGDMSNAMQLQGVLAKLRG
jgi:putative sterol carrier protein